MGNSDDRRAAFASALADERKRLGLSQRVVADRVNEKLPGRKYADASVGQWEKGDHVPEPDIVFAVEAVLALPGGTLSRHLGYVPVGASSVLSAIDSDPGLTRSARKHLEAVYRTMLDWVDS